MKAGDIVWRLVTYAALDGGEIVTMSAPALPGTGAKQCKVKFNGTSFNIDIKPDGTLQYGQEILGYSREQVVRTYLARCQQRAQTLHEELEAAERELVDAETWAATKGLLP